MIDKILFLLKITLNLKWNDRNAINLISVFFSLLQWLQSWSSWSSQQSAEQNAVHSSGQTDQATDLGP